MSLARVATPNEEHAPGLSEAERATRVDLAACYRLIHMFGMDDLIYTHISARVPGPEEHFLINPFGLLYEEVKASNLVKVDLDGNVIGDGDWGINPAGYVIHSCIHRERPDVGCVLHVHTVAGTAVSAQQEGLLPLTQTALLFHGHLAYHDYEGPALDTDEQSRLVADLGDKRVMILRNHGLLTAGRTIDEAFVLAYYLEQACRMQIAAQAGGGALRKPPMAVRKKTGALLEGGLGADVGVREFAALKRRLDAEGADYRE